MSTLYRGCASTDLQGIYGKFEQAGFSECEQLALEAFTRALLLNRVCTAGSWLDVVEAAGIAGMDVESMLDDVIAVQATHRATVIADALTAWAERWGGSRSHRFIWWKDPTHVVGRWLFSEDVRGYLLARFEAEPDDVNAGMWGEACDIIDALTETSPSGSDARLRRAGGNSSAKRR